MLDFTAFSSNHITKHIITNEPVDRSGNAGERVLAK